MKWIQHAESCYCLNLCMDLWKNKNWRSWAIINTDEKKMLQSIFRCWTRNRVGLFYFCRGEM